MRCSTMIPAESGAFPLFRVWITSSINCGDIGGRILVCVSQCVNCELNDPWWIKFEPLKRHLVADGRSILLQVVQILLQAFWAWTAL